MEISFKLFEQFIKEKWNSSMSAFSEEPWSDPDEFTEKYEAAMISLEETLIQHGLDIPHDFSDLLASNNRESSIFNTKIEEKFKELFDEEYQTTYDSHADADIQNDLYVEIVQRTERTSEYKRLHNYSEQCKHVELALFQHIIETHYKEFWPIYKDTIKSLYE